MSGPVVGGHAYLITGYSRVFHYFTMLNSYGIGWGRKGNTRIKADDMRQLIQDDGKAVVYLAEEVIVYIGGGIITVLVIIIILVLIF